MKKMKIISSIAIALFTCLSGYGQVTATYNEIISKQKKGNIDTYITGNGVEYSIGDSITLGKPYDACYIYVKNGTLTLYPDKDILNKNVKIRKIRVYMRKAMVYTSPLPGYTLSFVIQDMEIACRYGEILLHQPYQKKQLPLYTSEEALAELKKWKEKLDLGLIAPEDYDVKKLELAKYIE